MHDRNGEDTLLAATRENLVTLRQQFEFLVSRESAQIASADLEALSSIAAALAESCVRVQRENDGVIASLPGRRLLFVSTDR